MRASGIAPWVFCRTVRAVVAKGKPNLAAASGNAGARAGDVMPNPHKTLPVMVRRCASFALFLASVASYLWAKTGGADAEGSVGSHGDAGVGAMPWHHDMGQPEYVSREPRAGRSGAGSRADLLGYRRDVSGEPCPRRNGGAQRRDHRHLACCARRTRQAGAC